MSDNGPQLHRNNATAQAAVDLAEAQDLYNESYSDYYMIGKTIGSNISIKAAENALEQANVILARASKRVTKLSYLQDTDLAKLEAIEAEINAQQNVNTLMAQINYLKSTPDATVSALYDANFQLAKAQLESAQRAYYGLYEGSGRAQSGEGNCQRLVQPFQCLVRLALLILA